LYIIHIIMLLIKECTFFFKCKLPDKALLLDGVNFDLIGIFLLHNHKLSIKLGEHDFITLRFLLGNKLFYVLELLHCFRSLGVFEKDAFHHGWVSVGYFWYDFSFYEIDYVEVQIFGLNAKHAERVVVVIYSKAQDFLVTEELSHVEFVHIWIKVVVFVDALGYDVDE